jgi:DNA (cytosine-5)-methyltransferase 1
MIEAYKANFNPKYAYLEPIQTFKLREDLPQELYELDILDGSPPCSSFSIAGNRGKDWGKNKVFREGQAMQVLDTLFFDFIDLAKKLQPKVVIAENVKGLIFGEAKQYVRKIYREFDLAGYFCQHWLLDASKMGVPQKRERVFFIAMRKDLAKPFLKRKDLFTIVPELYLQFNEKKITFGEIRTEKGKDYFQTERGKLMKYRIKSDKCISDINMRINNKYSGYNAKILHDDEVCSTITAGEINWRYIDGMACSDIDYIKAGTFPLDYDFKSNTKAIAKYMIGMSVPPVMIAQIAEQVYLQWLSKLK